VTILWNEVTILWNEVTIWWNEVTKGWNEVAWNEVVMERSDRNSSEGPQGYQRAHPNAQSHLMSNL